MPSLTLLDDYQGVALGCAPWHELDGWDVRALRDPHPDEDALVAALAHDTAVVAMRERTAFPARVLERLPGLRLLITTGPANASIDTAAAARLGITVCGTRASAAAAPELSWALLMSAVRDIPGQQRALRDGRWQTGVGSELAGRTLGIVGLGKIGTRMARYARAFDMRVLAWSENLTHERAAEAGAELVSKADLFERSDIATLHLRMSDRTRHIVGEPELAALGPDGLLVNTARAGLVDTDALIAALASGALGGAALDVFDDEPLPPGHPLLRAPRTLLTPHIGYVTREQYALYYSDALEDVRAWERSAPIRVIAAPAG
ncbi:D-2-hydroxyacid dehydrogenase family protein [Microbacterium sp. MEC084]|uniref:D-2-hydroxyacid dehydrogenase family protein n=1 Tax=unclassified Microbacterium TaxID=2609290 RepID=UPI0006F67B75|nr:MULTISPECIES: D-2-hydroxyacid dehydrogenase family protein [unclassified Microbacterium]KQZ07292.1 hydroxyacid dehydrogenase [Microbacterium sp. Root53]MCD1269497.1 D-2-hydroxyacid dehydrogenase family protein [Microbacterium sp. MEC084]